MLRSEGGFSSDPDDPGNYVNGKFVGTKYGISANAYPHLDIRNLTVEQAKQIYKQDYWLRSGADKLPWPLCLLTFNAAVNAGVGQASSFLRASGDDPCAFVRLQRMWYRGLKTFPIHGRGWLNRMDAIEREANLNC